MRLSITASSVIGTLVLAIISVYPVSERPASLGVVLELLEFLSGDQLILLESLTSLYTGIRSLDSLDLDLDDSLSVIFCLAYYIN